MNRGVQFLRTGFFAILLLMMGGPIIAQVDWVGDMDPLNGSTVEGDGFLIRIEVFKTGVTPPGGQGADITCQIYYGEVAFFGDTWMGITELNMYYLRDNFNNDVYEGNLDLSAGTYEYTCRCQDNNNPGWNWQTAGNGQLTVLAALPVELTRFRAKSIGESIQLNWTTASEINNAYFAVERSVNGKNWKVLDQVAGAQNSQVQRNYEFMDEEPAAGTNYYRLRQVDFDGNFELSAVVEASMIKDDELIFSPNPVSDQLTIQAMGSVQQEQTIRVINPLGQVVFVQNVDLGANNSTINLQSLSPGAYWLQVIDNQGYAKSKRFIKQ